MSNLPSLQEIQRLTTEQIREYFIQSLEMTAKHLVHLGHLWRELENRGEDLSDLKKGIAIYIPMIAHGRLDARLVVSYAGQKMLLSALAELSKETQLQLINKPVVTIIDHDTNEQREIQLADIGAKHIAQVFDGADLRTPNEQLKFIQKMELNAQKKKKNTKARLTQKLTIEDNCIVVGNKRVEIARALEVLSKHYGKDIKALLDN